MLMIEDIFLKLIMMMYDHKEWYDWFIRISLIYIIIEIIYELKDNMSWQPDYVKDPINGAYMLVNNISWGFMSPVRPATCHQRDQR